MRKAALSIVTTIVAMVMTACGGGSTEEVNAAPATDTQAIIEAEFGTLDVHPERGYTPNLIHQDSGEYVCLSDNFFSIDLVLGGTVSVNGDLVAAEVTDGDVHVNFDGATRHFIRSAVVNDDVPVIVQGGERFGAMRFAYADFGDVQSITLCRSGKMTSDVGK